jgi:hypothetical protein
MTFDSTMNPEASWDRADAEYRSMLAQKDLSPVYYDILPVMPQLIERLSQHGLNRRYYAVRSHERLFILHLEHRDLIHAPSIMIDPREGGRLNCYFYRAKNLPIAPPTTEALNCDLNEAEQAILRMTELLDQYRDEIPPDQYNVPPEWYLS